jgi:hypothetical protein
MTTPFTKKQIKEFKRQLEAWDKYCHEAIAINQRLRSWWELYEDYSKKPR